jgi:hypothetical protein
MDVIIAPQSEATSPELAEGDCGGTSGDLNAKYCVPTQKKTAPVRSGFEFISFCLLVYTIFVKSKILWFYFIPLTARLADAFQPY